MSIYPREFLIQLFEEAVAAADPGLRIPAYLPDPPQGKLLVVGAGKASARMAEAVEMNWSGPLSGLVATRYGHTVPCEHIKIVEASHPTPDSASAIAAGTLLGLVSELGKKDHCLALISGGGSSILSAPSRELSIKDKREITSALLTCGAAIDEINCVRKHISLIKGGRLTAVAAPAQVTTLIISDVPGDDPSTIASGPTVADSTTLHDARDIISKYKIDTHPDVNVDALMRALNNPGNETPKPNHPGFENGSVHLIATPQQSLEAAASLSQKLGVAPFILGNAIQGEAREVAKVMAGIALQVRQYHQPIAPPCILLSGGETTVTVQGEGRGGRNVEFLLNLAVALNGATDIYAISADTDGIDGIEDIAGAVITPDSLIRGQHLGLPIQSILEKNDAHSFFEALDDHVVTGPTLTNVNDFRAILIR